MSPFLLWFSICSSPHTCTCVHTYIFYSHTRMLDVLFLLVICCCCKMRDVTCVYVSFVRLAKSNSIVKMNWWSYVTIIAAGAYLIEMLYICPVSSWLVQCSTQFVLNELNMRACNSSNTCIDWKSKWFTYRQTTI